MERIEQIKSIISQVKLCKKCPLGEMGLYAVCRGNPECRRMLVGEAAGKAEAIEHRTFVGPAGRLLHETFASVGWDTNKDFFLSNSIMCRPVAEQGSGRENEAPAKEYKEACRPYLNELIKIVDPRIIVLLGKVAITDFFPELDKVPMGKMTGRTMHHADWPDIVFYSMFHPSFLLRNQYNPSTYPEISKTNQRNLIDLKALIAELEG